MKMVRPLLLISATLMASVLAIAQSQLSSWPFFVEVSSSTSPGLYTLTVPLHVMGQARDDLGDLRLFDSENHEIPYAIRIRREIDEQEEFETDIFNEVTAGTSTEATIDLGEGSEEHNQVEIQTAGTNFRRRVTVEGSDSGTQWKTLKSDAVIFGFQAEGKAVESNTISYPASRYRYLRVRVNADEVSDDRAPDITKLTVLMAVREKGELTTWGVEVPSHQLIRNQGAHASAWLIDFGARVPCDRLSLTIADPSFYRPFQVETADDPQNPTLIASGNLNRRAGEEQKPQLITFDSEQHVRKLRLQITDYSNPILSIDSIQASAPARELVFELKQPQTLPLRLFFGNQKILEPHYDFENELSTKLKSPLLQSSLGDTNKNAVYTPEPVPFTERVPWLIYLVLAGSSVALGWILFSLARTTLQREPVQKQEQ
jgi:uncharacterized protein DUF3999